MCILNIIAKTEYKQTKQKIYRKNNETTGGLLFFVQ